MKHTMFALLALLFIVSCSQDDGPPPPSNDIGQELRGLEGAKQRLEKILATPEFRKQLTTKDNPMGIAIVADATMYNRNGDLLTRAEEDSANIYVFEFEDGGFAVLGEPPHMPELLAFSCDGSVITDSLNWDPTRPIIIDHSGDPIAYGDTSKIYDYSRTEYSCLGGMQPIKNKWHQRHPYNGNCDGNVAGCVPVAVALTMLHPSGRPTSFAGVVFDWEEMEKYGIPGFKDFISSTIGMDHICHLIKQVGRPENLNAQYGVNETSASIDKAPRTFQHFGYSNGGMISDYSFDIVKAEIESYFPVIMRGSIQPNVMGHAWVVSAIMEEKIPYKRIDPNTGLTTMTGVDTFYLIHCNWGWGDDNNRILNGFYIRDYFNPSKGPKVDDDGIPISQETNPGYGNYQYDLRIIHGIRK